MPGPHPDDDLLADLAADVLPVDQARVVEAHVLGCERCARLLSDADRVRGLLIADDPGPVPREVWNRIEAALAAENPRLRQAAGPAPSAPAADTVGWDGPDPLDDPGKWDGPARPPGSPAVAPPTTGSLSRLTPSRREARTERRRRLPSPLLLTAAAAVVLLAVVGSARLLQSAGNTSGASAGGALSSAGENSSGSDARAAVAATTIVSSGRNYTKQDLAEQVAPLIPAAGPKSAATTGSQAEGAPGASAAGEPPAAAAAPRAAFQNAAPVAPDPAATDVRNPQRLAACLSALNASSERLVAVDLARFQGREAAVLVLRTADGGYEVFVVERTCAPGDEGTLAYAQLPR